MTHPRDPRARRTHHRVDALDAAVRLEVAADAMRAALTGPEPEELAEFQDSVRRMGESVDPLRTFATDVVATAQLHTVEPPLTAQEFADALAAEDGEEFCPDCCAGMESSEHHERCVLVAESLEPSPVAVTPAPAPVFSSEQRRLDWRSRHDERSRLYGVRAVLPGSAALHDHLWPVGPVLDQGAEGACVGYAVASAENATVAPPVRYLEAAEALELYKRAQQLDEVPGEDYTGTSVLAGMRAAVEAGLFGGYRWAFGTRDVAQAVLQVGPVVVGVPWLAGMYDTGPGGLVVLEGDPVGGHCLAVVGIRLKGPQGQPGPFFVWQNSWGADYGDGGLGYIHHRDLAGLLHGVGEAAIPLETAQDPA